MDGPDAHRTLGFDRVVMSEMKDTALALLAERGPLGAIEWLSRQNDPPSIASTYADVVVHQYWVAHDLASVIQVGLAGIQFCLNLAHKYSVDVAGQVDGRKLTSPSLAESLKGTAKGLSYNLGSFCWPGWDEPGIVVGPIALAIGRDAASLNLRLALELDKGDVPLSRAHWLIAAHEMAIGNLEAARTSFDEGARSAAVGMVIEEQLLCKGFSLLARRLQDVDNAEIATELGRVKERLRKTANGPGLVQQIDTAESVFGRQ